MEMVLEYLSGIVHRHGYMISDVIHGEHRIVKMVAHIFDHLRSNLFLSAGDILLAVPVYDLQHLLIHP